MKLFDSEPWQYPDERTFLPIYAYAFLASQDQFGMGTPLLLPFWLFDVEHKTRDTRMD